MHQSHTRLYKLLSRQYKSASHDEVLDAISYADLVATERTTVFQESIGNIEAYQACVARRALGARYRQKRRYVYIQAQADNTNKAFDEVLNEVVDTVEDVEHAMDVRTIVNALSPKHAEVLRLHYVEGLTLDEASKLAGVTPECMRKRHERALHQARKIFTTAEERER